MFDLLLMALAMINLLSGYLVAANSPPDAAYTYTMTTWGPWSYSQEVTSITIHVNGSSTSTETCTATTVISTNISSPPPGVSVSTYMTYTVVSSTTTVVYTLTPASTSTSFGTETTGETNTTPGAITQTPPPSTATTQGASVTSNTITQSSVSASTLTQNTSNTPSAITQSSPPGTTSAQSTSASTNAVGSGTPASTISVSSNGNSTPSGTQSFSTTPSASNTSSAEGTVQNSRTDAASIAVTQATVTSEITINTVIGTATSRFLTTITPVIPVTISNGVTLSPGSSISSAEGTPLSSSSSMASSSSPSTSVGTSIGTSSGVSFQSSLSASSPGTVPPSGSLTTSDGQTYSFSTATETASGISWSTYANSGTPTSSAITISWLTTRVTLQPWTPPAPTDSSLPSGSLTVSDGRTYSFSFTTGRASSISWNVATTDGTITSVPITLTWPTTGFSLLPFPPPASTITGPTSSDSDSPDLLSLTFSTPGVPQLTGDSTGLVTVTADNTAITWTLVDVEDSITETGIDSRGSTVTVSHITTFLVPSAVGSHAPSIGPPGGISVFTAPSTTIGPGFCNITDTYNPWGKTTNCSFAPAWASTARAYDPVCSGTRCLCPICTLPQYECLEGDIPTDGHCPEGWLCSLSSPPAPASNLVWSWAKTPNVDLPWCPATWSQLITCVTADDAKSCSSVTYTTSLSTSTSTDSNGTVWAMPVRVWDCPDALCDEHSFKLPFPFGWLKFIINCAFHDHWSCITWLFKGFPPAPKIVFPPIGPPGFDWELKSTAISTRGGDGKTTPVTSPLNSGTETASDSRTSSSTSTCTTTTAISVYELCSVVTTDSTITATSCSPTTATITGCDAMNTMSTSTMSCSSTLVHTEYGVYCPLDSDNHTITTDSALCNTSSLFTFTGCADTTTTAGSCPISIDYNDPGIAETLSSWLSQFTFTLPNYTITATNMSSGTASSTIPKITTSNMLNSTESSTVTDLQLPSDVSASAYSWLASDASEWSSYVSSKGVSAISSLISSQVSVITSLSAVSASSASSVVSASLMSVSRSSVSVASSKSSVAAASSSAASASAASVSHAAATSAKACAASNAFPTPTAIPGKPLTSFTPNEIIAEAFINSDKDTPFEGWKDDADHFFLQVWLDTKKPDTGKDQFASVVVAACRHLRDNSDSWDPTKGWYYTWTNENGPNPKGFPGVPGDHNVTFGVRYVREVRCDDCESICYDKNSYCPPPEDGKVGKDFWELDDDNWGRCVLNFYRAVSGFSQSTTEGYEQWNVGGTYVEDTGFFWSVWSPAESTTGCGWNQMGSGEDEIVLDYSDTAITRKQPEPAPPYWCFAFPLCL